MTNNLGQVPDYARVKYYQSILDKAKKDYLKHLISLGYILERTDSFLDTIYIAIHPDYYLTNNERGEKEREESRYIPDGKYYPENYPEGAFIVINSFCISDSPDYMICASDFLNEDVCSLEYLGE